MNNFPGHEKDIQLNSLIQQMAQQHQPELPSAGVIWWRAQLLRKMEEKKRIERPVMIMRMLAGALALGVTVYLSVAYRGELVSRSAFSSSLLPVSLVAIGFLVIYLITSLRESTS